jgi:putative membrane protein
MRSKIAHVSCEDIVGEDKMNIRIISALTVVALAAGIGVTEAKTTKTAKTTTTKTAKAKPAVSPSVSKLMVEIAKGNMVELKLSEAAQSATNEQVKAFAKQMIDAHTQMGNSLGNVASSKSVSLPSELDPTGQRMLDKLKATSGPAFDKTYMTDIIAGHRKVLAQVRSLAAKAKDADVKTLAEGAVPEVSKHLEMATSINASLSKPAPTATK